MKQLALTALCLCGCVSEYHPEFHPVSIVSVEQHQHEAQRQEAPAPYMSLFRAREEADPFAVAAPIIAPIIAAPIIVHDDVAPTPRRAVVYIGGGVQINGNVTINGDVVIGN